MTITVQVIMVQAQAISLWGVRSFSHQSGRNGFMAILAALPNKRVALLLTGIMELCLEIRSNAPQVEFVTGKSSVGVGSQ